MNTDTLKELALVHTPEPWAVNGTRRIESRDEHGWANDGWIIADTDGPQGEANARRIVACVNACAGVSVDFLEGFAHGVQISGNPLDKVLELAHSQRDELLAALIELRSIAVRCDGWSSFPEAALDAAHEAIAKAVQP